MVSFGFMMMSNDFAVMQTNVTPLQSNTERLQGWCTATFMKLNISFHYKNKWF